MAGVFSAGDVLLVKKATISKLVAGDVVSYRSPRDPNIVITHRAVAVIATVVTAKGDRIEPPDLKVPAHLIIGQAVLVLPKLGAVLDFTHCPLGLILSLYIPLLVIIYEVCTLFKYYHRPTYFLVVHRICHRLSN